MDDRLSRYRSFLIEAEQKAQEQYDKTILTLSGGAFGISFAFVDNFASDPTDVCWLLCSWISWGASITAILASFYFSTLALRQAVNQVDSDSEDIREVGTPGGYFTKTTKVCNAIGGFLFFVGAVLIVVFVGKNIQ